LLVLAEASPLILLVSRDTAVEADYHHNFAKSRLEDPRSAVLRHEDGPATAAPEEIKSWAPFSHDLACASV
jgi:hypothetical protein